MDKQLMASELGDKANITYEVEGTEIKLTPKIVQDFIVGGQVNITAQEYKFFVELCKVRKLNPFTKEAYLIKYGSQPAQIVVGKDAILKRAIRHPKFNGREQGIIISSDKGIEYRKGTFKLSDDKEKLVGGWARVWRKDWEYPVEITVAFDEVAQRKSDGVLNSNWNQKGATMVEKVALVRALREAFVEELGGMIDENEAWNKETKQVIEEQHEPHEVIVIDETDVNES